MIFKVGDICTYNRFEVRIESIDEENKKVEISYAVFVNDERIFDENDRKIVPMNRVKLAHRQFEQFGAPTTTEQPPDSPSSVPESLTFSVRKERFHIQTPPTEMFRDTKRKKRRKNLTPKLIFSDTESRTSDLHSRKRSFKKIEARPRTERLDADDSSGSSPVRIVPDSYLDSDKDSNSSFSSSSSSSSSYVSSDESLIDNSESQFSQEREAMRKLASSYERRSAAEANHTVSDEVEFVAWDPKTKRVIGDRRNSSSSTPFVVMDETDDPRRRSSVTPFIGRIEEIAQKFSIHDDISTASTAASIHSIKPPINLNDHIVHGLWPYMDTISVLDPWAKLDFVLEQLDEVIESIQKSTACTGNTATDLRMVLTGGGPPPVKTHLGWLTVFYTTLWLTRNLKPQLFVRISETIFEKFSPKTDVKLIFMISYLFVMAKVPTTGSVNIENGPIQLPVIIATLSTYSSQGTEIQKLLRVFVSVLMDNCSHIIPSFSSSIPELLPFLASLVSAYVCPKPLDVTLSVNERLDIPENSFVDKVIDFLVTNFPPIGGVVLIKCGGFIPSINVGSSILSFSKLRGKTFANVIRYERGFCDWAERLTDPFSAECIDFIDFVCLDRYWCSLGPRTLKADIEYLRLAKENMAANQVELWIANRGLLCLKILKFFYSLAMRFPSNKSCLEYVAYASCAYDMFRLIGIVDLPDHQMRIGQPLPKPRGEFVKEVIRPILRLASLFPKYEPQIRSGILQARAKAYECSIETAANELRSIHGIFLTVN